MLVQIWAFGFLLTVGGAVLVGAFQMQRSAATSHDRLNSHAALADQFRADVAAAADAPAQAGRTALVLHMPDGRRVAYRWQDRRLERSVQAGEERAEQWLPVGPDCTAVEFTRAAAAQPLLTLRLTEKPVGGGPERRKEISAALGGDLR
jgi:hypothetical protein